MISMRKPTIVGRPMVRVEGLLKATGQARYLDDLTFGVEPLYARLVLSQRAHAGVTLDTSQAEAIPGVVKVLTGRDLTGVIGRYLYDRSVLPLDRARYAGQPLAVVAATTPETAERAARSVQVSYVDLPGVFGLAEALEPQAPLLHPALDHYQRHFTIVPQPGSNIAHESHSHRGDVNAGWSEAAVVVEDVYEAAPMHHMAMEPHGAVALMEADGRITLWASTQAPYLQHQMICQALGLAPERLRVLTAYVGGSFGGKAFVSIEVLAVALAMTTPERPVKLVLPRAEDFSSTFTRPGLIAHLKMGATREGDLTALEAHYDWDAGASADAIIEMIGNTVYTGTGPYRIPHVSIRARAIYTNRAPAAPMRGNGMAELQWALEQHIDRVAHALEIDALAFRLRNCLKGGDALFDGRKMHATGLDICLRRVAKAVHWPGAPGKPSARHKRRGLGVAIGWNPVLDIEQEARSQARAVVRLDADAERGPILLDFNGVDIGQGLHTVAVQLAASTLGAPLAWVRAQPSAESLHPGFEQAPRSQLTWSTGNAVMRAAGALRADILGWVANAWQEAPGNLDIVEGQILSYATHRRLSLLDYIREARNDSAADPKRRILSAEGVFQPDLTAAGGATVHPGAPPILQIGIGAQAVEVEVDLDTGEVQVLRLVAAFDAGHAINPDIVEAQIRGGAIQGLSAALFEQFVFDADHPLHQTLADYRIATIQDVPASMEALTVEVPQEDGPFGARGVGEHTAIAAAPALANAVYRATGARMRRLPISSESIWLALHSVANSNDAG